MITAVEATQFVRRFVDWAKIDKNPKEGCNKKEFIYWNCCDFHRQLNTQINAFHNEATKFEIQSEGQVFSVQWFLDFCTKYGITMPEDRPEYMKP